MSRGGSAVAAAMLAAGLGLTPGGGGAGGQQAGTIAVSLAGSARTVTPTLLGLNGVDTGGPAWNDAGLDSALGEFAPGVIRYPGGTAANYWSWTAGWFQPGQWPGEPHKPVDDTLPVFATGLHAAGATPLWDLNTVTYDGALGSAADDSAMLHVQLQALHAAVADGMPVTMVELGNELYLNGYTNRPPGNPHADDYLKRFPTAADYAEQMNHWIAALHKAFPGVQVAAVATDAEDVPHLTQRRATWNADVLPILRGEDAVTIHENLRVFSAASLPADLAFPYLHFQKLEANEMALFASYHLPVWITEFNLADHTPGHVLAGTWLQGLFAADEALLFLSDPAITYLGLNGTMGTAGAGAIFSNDEGFGRGGPPTVPLALTSAGVTMAAIGAAFAGGSAAQPLGFSPSPELAGTGAPALAGESVTTGSGTELVLVNLSDQPYPLDLSSFYSGQYSATEVTAASVTTKVTGPSSVATSTSTGTGPLTVPAYSLVTVTSG
jgi:hypothetical protein